MLNVRIIPVILGLKARVFLSVIFFVRKILINLGWMDTFEIEKHFTVAIRCLSSEQPSSLLSCVVAYVSLRPGVMSSVRKRFREK